MVKLFSVNVVLAETNEVFTAPNISSNTTVADLKLQLELIAGIPTHLQRLMYLDEGDMEDTSTLKHHDVVSGAKLTMRIWNSWASLVEACVAGNITKVMSLGVTPDNSYRNPNIDRMTTKVRNEYFQARSAIALYIASHRGHVHLMKALIKSGTKISATTKHGRNALHVAAANGQNRSIDLMLESGAGKFAENTDKNQQTPLQTAVAAGHKSAARELFLYQWRRRASKMQKLFPAEQTQLMAHQLYDSSSQTWLQGEQQQHYQSQILPPQEFQGTGLGAKRSDYNFSQTVLSSSQSDNDVFHGPSTSAALHAKPVTSKNAPAMKKLPLTSHKTSKQTKSFVGSSTIEKNKRRL